MSNRELIDTYAGQYQVTIISGVLRVRDAQGEELDARSAQALAKRIAEHYAPEPFVYVGRNGDLMKIGQTEDVERRLGELEAVLILSKRCPNRAAAWKQHHIDLIRAVFNVADSEYATAFFTASIRDYTWLKRHICSDDISRKVKAIDQLSRHSIEAFRHHALIELGVVR
jgi:hypothetical protein